MADRNYEGATSATLRLNTTALVRHPPELHGGIDGSVHLITGSDVYLDGMAWIFGDLLVPGTPTVIAEGNALYSSVLQGSGVAEPSDFSILMQGNAVLRSIVMRVDPLAPPVLDPLPVPAGTLDVVLNKRGQEVADFSTLRNLTVTGTADEVAVPPGTYGTLVAGGGGGFRLGAAGSTAPSVYCLQSLTFAGRSALTLAGSVVLRVSGQLMIQTNDSQLAQPGELRIEAHDGDVILDDCGVISATIIAPNAKVILRGVTRLRGRVVARELEIHQGAVLTEPLLNP